MDDNDRNLLLTTARILRAHLNDEIAEQRFSRTNRLVLASMKRDRDDLNEVLEPYSLKKAEPSAVQGLCNAIDDLTRKVDAKVGASSLSDAMRDEFLLDQSKRERDGPLNPEAQHTMHGGTKPFFDTWGCGPNFLILHPDGVRCQCGGIVEHCGEAAGNELFQCRACGTRGSTLADRDILPEQREGFSRKPISDLPAEVASAIRDGQAHQRDRFSKHGDPIPPPPPRTGVQKGGVPMLRLPRLRWPSWMR